MLVKKYSQVSRMPGKSYFSVDKFSPNSPEKRETVKKKKEKTRVKFYLNI